jgi:hypothetical protein
VPSPVGHPPVTRLQCQAAHALVNQGLQTRLGRIRAPGADSGHGARRRPDTRRWCRSTQLGWSPTATTAEPTRRAISRILWRRDRYPSSAPHLLQRMQHHMGRLRPRPLRRLPRDLGLRRALRHAPTPRNLPTATQPRPEAHKEQNLATTAMTYSNYALSSSGATFRNLPCRAELLTAGHAGRRRSLGLARRRPNSPRQGEVLVGVDGNVRVGVEHVTVGADPLPHIGHGQPATGVGPRAPAHPARASRGRRRSSSPAAPAHQAVPARSVHGLPNAFRSRWFSVTVSACSRAMSSGVRPAKPLRE